MKKTDLEAVLRDVILHGAALPRGYDVATAVEALMKSGKFDALGRIAARALLEKSLSRLVMRRTILLASIKKPPVH